MTTEEILIRLGVNSDALARGLRSAKEQVSEWGHHIKSELLGTVGGLFAAEAIGETIHKTIEYGSHIADLSKRLGVSAEAVQVWDYALKQNGGTIESAIGFFEKLAVARDKALKGEVDVAASFKALGVSLEDLKNKRIEDIAESIGEVFKAGDPQQLIGALRDVGGKGAGEMVATFAEGIKEAREEAEKLGTVLSSEVVQSLKRVDDEFVRFKAQQTGWIAPMLAKDLEGLNYLWVSMKAWWNPKEAQHLWDEMIEADKAMRRKESATNPAGNLSESETASHHATALEIRKAARKMEADADREKLSLEDKIRSLYEDRNGLMDQLDEKGRTEIERAKTVKDLAENRKAIAEKEVELKAKIIEHEKTLREISKLGRSKIDSENAPFMSSVQELAQSGYWSKRGGSGWRFNQGPYAKEARRMEWLQADAKDAMALGNMGRFRGDKEEYYKIKNDLTEAGVLPKEDHLETIKEQMIELNRKAADEGIKISGGQQP